jgi:hypothetical protein
LDLRGPAIAIEEIAKALDLLVLLQDQGEQEGLEGEVMNGVIDGHAMLGGFEDQVVEGDLVMRFERRPEAVEDGELGGGEGKREEGLAGGEGFRVGRHGKGLSFRIWNFGLRISKRARRGIEVNIVIDGMVLSSGSALRRDRRAPTGSGGVEMRARRGIEAEAVIGGMVRRSGLALTPSPSPTSGRGVCEDDVIGEVVQFEGGADELFEGSREGIIGSNPDVSTYLDHRKFSSGDD